MEPETQDRPQGPGTTILSGLLSFGKTYLIVSAVIVGLIILLIIGIAIFGNTKKKEGYLPYTSGASLRTNSAFSQPSQGARA